MGVRTMDIASCLPWARKSRETSVQSSIQHVRLLFTALSQSVCIPRSCQASVSCSSSRANSCLRAAAAQAASTGGVSCEVVEPLTVWYMSMPAAAKRLAFQRAVRPERGRCSASARPLIVPFSWITKPLQHW